MIQHLAQNKETILKQKSRQYRMGSIHRNSNNRSISFVSPCHVPGVLLSMWLILTSVIFTKYCELRFYYNLYFIDNKLRLRSLSNFLKIP